MGKLRYEAEKHTRVNYCFVGMTTFSGWWFNETLMQWEHTPKFGEYTYSTHQPCRTVKAFKRKLKKAPKGVEFTLVSRWIGYNVAGVGCG